MAFLKEIGSLSIIPVIRALLLGRRMRGEDILRNMAHNSTMGYGQNHSMESVHLMNTNISLLNIKPKPEDVMVQYAFFIPALLFVIAGVTHCIYMIKKGCHLRQTKSVDTDTSQGVQHILSRTRCISLGFTFGALAFSTGCLTDGVSMFLFSFTVKYMQWSKVDAALLVTIFSVSSCIASLLFTAISNFLRPQNSLWITDLLQLMIILFCTPVFLNKIVIWIIVICLGVGAGTLENLVPSWMATLFGPSGRWTAFYFSIAYLARTGAGWFLGYLFDEQGPICFVYFNTISVIVFVLAHITGYISTEMNTCGSRKYEESNNQKDVDTRANVSDKDIVQQMTNI